MVHCELVKDLTTNEFLLAFRRLCARKGFPNLLISDNASTFEDSSIQLKNLLLRDDLIESLAKQNCTWKFVTKRAPWMNGFVERLIGMTKSLIKKTLRNCKLKFSELQTLLCEVECVLNNRPLTYLDSDLGPEPLTPAKLMYGRNLSMCPYPIIDDDYFNDPDFNVDRNSLLERAKYRALLFKQFVNRWKSEYLTSLREFQSCFGKLENKIKKGDVVLIYEDKVNRLNWNLGLVTELHYSRDNLIRSVSLKTKFGVTNRSIKHLYPLEVNYENIDELVNVTHDAVNTVNPEPTSRPSRVAKSLANQKIQSIFNQ